MEQGNEPKNGRLSIVNAILNYVPKILNINSHNVKPSSEEVGKNVNAW